MKVPTAAVPLLFLLNYATLPPLCAALSMPSPSESAQLAYGRLRESLSSLANKATLSPEIIIPEPTDPTALLLQASEVTTLSNRMRNNAKANAVFISGSVNSIRSFCAEQETARGNFPSPLPVIVCESSYGGEESADFADIAEAGASGVLHCLLEGKEISSVEDIKADTKLLSAFESARDNGIQLIPEIVLSREATFDEADVTAFVEAVAEKCGSEPAVVLLTVGTYQNEDDKEGGVGGEMKLPQVSKTLKKRIPILGSVREVAGGGRIGSSVNNFKECGYTGTILRCECLPGVRMNPDLDFVGGFWSAAIGDLKSLKSKTFNFRSKVSLDKDVPMEWYNYQKDIMDSGALGGPDDAGVTPLDSGNGDYQGF